MRFALLAGFDLCSVGEPHPGNLHRQCGDFPVGQIFMARHVGPRQSELDDLRQAVQPPVGRQRRGCIDEGTGRQIRRSSFKTLLPGLPRPAVGGVTRRAMPSHQLRPVGWCGQCQGSLPKGTLDGPVRPGRPGRARRRVDKGKAPRRTIPRPPAAGLWSTTRVCAREIDSNHGRQKTAAPPPK